MKYEEKINGEYIERIYENGTIVKTIISQETQGEIIELPKNPILSLQEENTKLKDIADKLILDNLNMQIQIDTLITNSLGGM